MSAAYHVCPTETNVQFDYTFMYVTVGILLWILLHRRRADPNEAMNVVYGGCAYAVLLNILGLRFSRSGVFWIILGLFDLILTLYLLFSVFVRWEPHRFCSTSRIVWRSPWLTSVLPLSVLLVVWSLFVYGFRSQGSSAGAGTEFSQYLLVYVVSVFAIVLLFYIIRKIQCGERIHWYVILHGVVSIVLAVLALKQLKHRIYNKRALPYTSRELNEDCVLFGLFDAHDIWHFLSTFAVYFGAMMILTIDDDLIMELRSRIHTVEFYDGKESVICGCLETRPSSEGVFSRRPEPRVNLSDAPVYPRPLRFELRNPLRWY